MTRARAYVAAARPATLPAAVAPVLVGGGLAVDDGAFRWDVFVVALAASLAINVGVNYANDVSDARRGADDSNRIGPRRAVASGWLTARQMWAGVAAAFGVATVCGVYLTAVAGWVVVIIGVASLAAALGYTGGPVPYGYRALGELFVFVFFGLVATVGSRYVHDRTAPLDVWLLAIPIGFLVTAILVANNVRDIDGDRRSGKRTLAVVLGRTRTRILYGGLIAGAFAALGGFAAGGWVPGLCALGLLAVPLAVAPVLTVVRETDGARLIAALKANGRLHFVFGALVAVGAAL